MDIGYLHPSQTKDFFRHLCLISLRYAKKYHSKELASSEERHLMAVPAKKYKSENLQTNDASMLKARINELENLVEQIRNERDSVIEQNRKKIDELNLALLSVKSKTEELLHAKRLKERRTRELEKKINKKR